MNESPIIDYPGRLHHIVNEFIQGLGSSAQDFWKITALIFVLLLVFLGSGNFVKKSNSENALLKNIFYSKTLFILIIIIGTLILRSPNFILFQQNPDESQWMVGAATLIEDPRFWISVDGKTSGPLVIFPLASIHFLGGSINYANVRLFALLVCIIPSVLFTYATIANIFDDRVARIIILPLAIFMALISYWDFIAYNSEHIPILLISACIFLYSRIFTSKVIKSVHLNLNSLLLAAGMNQN